MDLTSYGNPPPWLTRPYLIAEAGVNHNGDRQLAHRLIEAAHAAGADAVKFQTWLPGEQVGRFATKIAYLERGLGQETFFDASERLRLTFEDFVALHTQCKSLGIEFLSTADGPESFAFLVDKLNVPFVKVGSTELNHPQFLSIMAARRRPVILSTGMGTLGEVESALGVIRQVGGEQIPVVVLHCTSEYPARPEDMNLRAMTTMAQAFHVPVGLSDHSQGIEAAIAAIALGGCVIEKHFTLDRKMDGPDHEASLEPEALAALVQAMRRTAIMLGDGIKQPVAIEQSNMVSIRRSVVASRDLPPNTVLQLSDLICKRPGHGIAPANLNNLVGMRINRAIEMDEPILWNDLISG